MGMTIYKAPNRETYAIKVSDSMFLVPALMSVYSCGTSDPQTYASLTLTGGCAGFWTTQNAIDPLWVEVAFESLSPKWRAFAVYTRSHYNLED